MTKTDIIGVVAENTGTTKVATKAVIDAFIDAVKECVANDDEVNILGFGKFYAAERAGRVGRNPQTGEAIDIPASKSPRFKAGKAFKDVVKDI